MVEPALDVLYDDDMQAYMDKLVANANVFFEQCGKEPMQIYRIMKFEPVRQEKNMEGKFYDGDSYVCVKDNKKNFDIHYWHGKDATSDETGTSAALSVMISETLPMASRHHLEEMEYESDLFLSYFKGGIFYLPGGCESGFRKLEDTVHEPKLYLIKGRRYPRVFSMPVEANSLNDGDCFLLDMGDKLYHWRGAEANTIEVNKSRDLADGIRNDERSMKATILFPQEQGGACEEEFWTALGGKPDKINPAIPDDAPVGTEADFQMCKLFHISDASGKLEMNEVTERPLKRSHLDDNDTYILELYNQVYVWQGSGATKQEKQMGIKYAKDFVNKNNKPKGTKISRLPQGCEDTNFKSFFEGFYDTPTIDYGADKGLSSTQADQDISKVAAQQEKAKSLLFDKIGSNWTKTVYHLGEDFRTPVKVTDPQEEGKFFAETNYIVDIQGSGHRYVIQWFGPRATVEHMQGMASAVETVLGGVFSSDDTCISVKKGHETESFLSFFPDGFAILDEARIPWADWMAKSNQNGVMFRINAPFGGSARAIEQNSRSAQYLNSGDAFTVFMPGMDTGHVWHGPGANDVEKKAAYQLFTHISKPTNVFTVDEGQETEDFWAAVGGQGEYSHVKDNSMIAPEGFEPRLFTVSNTSGYMWMQELPAFGQEDLCNWDCHILDAYSTIFVWVGALSDKFERKGALTRAQKYLDGVTDKRNKDDVMIQEIEAGHEPPMFTVQFIQWEPEVAAKWIAEDPRTKAAEVAEEKKVEERKADDPFNGYLDPETNKFTYEELKGKFPKGVKPQLKEAYLKDDEFATVFKMTRAEFNALKGYKRIEKRQEFGLY